MIEQDRRLSVEKIRHIIRSITEQDVGAYHALRLAGLEAHPEAFGETVPGTTDDTPQDDEASGLNSRLVPLRN